MREIKERRRHCLRQYKLPLFRPFPNGQTLRQGFDQSHAERPNVPSRQDRSACHLGWVVDARLPQTATRFAYPAKPVTRDFHLIIDGHYVCGFHVTVHEAFAVNVRKGVQSRFEHLACLRWRERSVWKNLRQVLFGVLHHDVEQPCVTKLAASHLEEPDQVRMRQLRRQHPPGKLEFRVPRIRRNEFDRGFLRFPLTVFRKEHGAVFTATQVLAQVEFPIDDLAFPLFPGFAHSAPPPVRSLKSALLCPSSHAGGHPEDVH